MVFLSCIITVYNEELTLKSSIISLLTQSFKDFEIIVVDDGSNEITVNILNEFNDPRIKYIRQSNDGPSSARNRGLKHCNGDYICFLDGDDMRPVWAFEEIENTIKRNQQPDCIFTKGSLVELRNDIYPFYDSDLLNLLAQLDFKRELNKCLPYLMLLEPSSTNKIIKRSFIKKYQLCFPNGLCFEDTLFHMGVIANLDSFAITPISCFSYFRRYGRPHLTSITGEKRMESIAVVFMGLDMFSKSERFQNEKIRLALLITLFKIIKWCEESVSHYHKNVFHLAVSDKVKVLDPLYLAINDELPLEYEGYSDVMDYFKRCKV